VLWKDSDELLRLGQPECGSWGERGKGGVRGQRTSLTFLAPSPAPNSILKEHSSPPLTPRHPGGKQQGPKMKAKNSIFLKHNY
jgi:hypothetical protein